MYEDSRSSDGATGGGGGAVSMANKTCVVCGDRALSCNFGAITCESCKAFFRRHAHKEIYGQCDGSCPITVETRSYCRRCRLAKCFTVGMKKELILSDEQKQRRRQKILENRTKRQSQEVFTADSTGIMDYGGIGGGGGGGGGLAMSTGEVTSPDGSVEIPPVWSMIPTANTTPDIGSSTSPPTQQKRDVWESFGQAQETEVKRPALVGAIPDPEPKPFTDPGIDKTLAALSEPCFFGLHPPSLESFAFAKLDKDVQQRVLTAVEAYKELCRPLVTLHDKPEPADYVSLLNRGEECYRQLVRFCKRLPEFRSLSQDDQIALLKGNVIEIMIVRFSKCYNRKTNSWMFPHCGDIHTYSGMLESNIFSGFCVQDYANFVANALEITQGDDLILILLKTIILFWPDVPNIEDKESVQATFNAYTDTLESYLRVVYPDEPDMIRKVHGIVTQLRDVGKKAHDVMWKSQVEDLHPLLKEMFDLR